MKFLLLSLLSVTLLSTSSFAQYKKNLDDHNHHHGSHGEYAERTVDPFGNPVKLYTDPPVANDTDEFDPPLLSMDAFNEILVEAEYLAAKRGATPTRVYLVADTEYIATHGGNWLTRILTIFNSARVTFSVNQGIELVPAGFMVWDSNGSTNSQILADLASDFSHITDGIVVGFTDDPNFTAGGRAYVYGSDPGTGYNVNANQSISATTYAVRHEISHNYSLSHDAQGSGIVCMMNYDYAYSVDYWDSAHWSELAGNSGWFIP